MKIRPLAATDNKAIAEVIRTTLVEFGANHPGTVYFDPTTDHLFELFQEPQSMYWVVENEGKIAGGAGIFPTKGLPAGTCELVKLYLLPEARGKGTGKNLMNLCHQKAMENGFNQVYLETMPELTIAVPLYEKMGYQYLDDPLGESGHFGCAIQMMKKLMTET
jgi:putative acetyltransferase